MKVPTPEGIKDAEGIEFRVEGGEQPVRVVLSDGAVLVSRSIINSVYAFTYNDGSRGYYIDHHHAITKIGL